MQLCSVSMFMSHFDGAFCQTGLEVAHWCGLSYSLQLKNRIVRPSALPQISKKSPCNLAEQAASYCWACLNEPAENPSSDPIITWNISFLWFYFYYFKTHANELQSQSTFSLDSKSEKMHTWENYNMYSL